MPMICVQCALRAFVRGESAPQFDETSEQHMARYHPDPVKTEEERKLLEEQMSALLQAAMDEGDLLDRSSRFQHFLRKKRGPYGRR